MYRQTDRWTDKLIWGGLGNFLITPYPPPLIGPYHDYCATPDEEYDLMSNEVRNRILKASPHA